MRAKMKIFVIIFSLFCVILKVRGDDGHHIDQRILENQLADEDSFNDTNSNIISSVEADLKPEVPFNVSSMLRNISDTLNTTTPSIKIQDVQLPELLKNNKTEQVSQINSESIDKEVNDLLNSDELFVQNHQHPLEPLEPLHIPDKIDKETELIDDGQHTEDELRRHRDENVGSPDEGPLTTILVSSFVVLAVLCYVGLLLWRRYLEHLYGSRTLLVDSEELPDPDDLKHFSI